MQKIIMTKGLPASGKSTWAKKLVEDNPGKYKRINKDDLRWMMDNYKHSKLNEKFVLETRDWLVQKAIEEGYSVVIDDTNFADRHEIRMQEIAREFRRAGKKVEVQVNTEFLQVPIEDCIKRDLARPNSVGEKVIRDMYKRYLKPAELIQYPTQNDKLPRILLVDIDGTVAEKGDRSPFDWKNVGRDKPRQAIIDMVKAMSDDYGIVFFSGRDSVCRKETVEWINKHFDWKEVDDYSLFMREENDMRKDSIVKREMWEIYIKDDYYVHAVLDDRNQVVDMWRKELGFDCLQVNYGDF